MTVVDFKPASIGAGFRFDSDEILELAKGLNFITFALVGQLEDGSIWTDGNANAGEMIILMERAKHHLVFGEE